MAPEVKKIEKVAIIGVGLIGGSIAMVLRDRGLAAGITGIGRGRKNLETALRLGIVDSITTDVEKGVSGAGLVVVAVPVLKTAEVIKKALPALKGPCIITDVGSVKKAVIDEVTPLLPAGVNFVPAHPVAGTEESGAGAAFPELFNNRLCVITPTNTTGREALDTVRRIWEEAGSKVVEMDPVAHDRVFSAVSHLPHMIAYTLVNTVAREGKNESDIFSFSAGGFRDFTRIASSSPEMWADICALNGDFIVKMIERFEENLERLKGFILRGDLDGVREEFRKAKEVRDSIA